MARGDELPIRKLREKINSVGEELEIELVICDKPFFDYLLEQDGFHVTPSNELRNRFMGVDVARESTVDGYEIATKRLFYTCDVCSGKKMFDEENDCYYCPHCDTWLRRLKDKIYKLRD